MALTSTTYTLHLGTSDTDLGVYKPVHQTIARHPSETEERLVARILAFGVWFSEDLEFGRGLSDVDEPTTSCGEFPGAAQCFSPALRPGTSSPRIRSAAKTSPASRNRVDGSRE